MVISHHTREAYDDLCNKQAATLADPSTDKAEEEVVAFSKWNLLSGLEEGYLKKKTEASLVECRGSKQHIFP